MTNKKGILSFLAAIASSQVVEPEVVKTKLSEEDRALKQELIKLNKGLKKFSYGDEYIFALNQKNADRKAKKLGLI